MAKTRPTDAGPPPTPPGVPPDGSPVTGEPGKKPPPFGTAVAAGAGDLPREVPQLARAGRGELRIKVACRNYSPRETRYILVADGDDADQQAEACYLAAEGLDKELARLRKIAGPKADEVEPPALALTRLPD